MLYATAVSLMAATAVMVVGIIVWRLRKRHLRALEKYSIDPEDLRALLEQGAKVQVFDVRQPLDVLAYSEMIPGAKRIPPKEIHSDPSLIPSDTDAVVYCTCGGQKTSREIIERALRLGFTRVKLLRGGLSAWKAKGFPVVPYKDAFHLDTAV